MIRNYVFIVTFTFVLSFGNLRAQRKNLPEYFYRSGMCTYTLTPDTMLINPIYFANTLNAIASPLEHGRTLFPSHRKDTMYISKSQIEEENNALIDRLEKTILIPSPFWDSIKRIQLDGLIRLSKLRNDVVTLILNPKSFVLSNPTKLNKKYITSIQEGGKKLKKMWKKVHSKSLISASDPDLLENVYMEQSGRKDWEFYARMEIIRYGYYNDELKQIQPLGNYAQLEKELFKNCSKVEKRCQ
jgi:hypothetical protein